MKKHFFHPSFPFITTNKTVDVNQPHHSTGQDPQKETQKAENFLNPSRIQDQFGQEKPEG